MYMKVTRTYTIDEDLVKLLEPLNSSATINELLTKYFEADITDNIPAMRSKLLELMKKKKQISIKIRHFKDKIAQKQAKIDAKKANNLTMQQQSKRKAEVAAHQFKYTNGDITEEEYWKFFD